MEVKGLIFDFDGTLADTLPVCIIAFQQTIEQITGKPFPREDVKKYFGKSEEGMAKLIAPLQWKDCLSTYLELYQKNHYLCDSLFEGIQEILDYLKLNKYKMAMVTGRGKQTTDIGLNYFNIGHYFEHVETGSSEGSIKPECIKKILNNWQLPPENVVYIGDSVHDIQDSLEAGIKPIAVSWASTSNHEELISHNPHLIFSNVSDFKNWVMSLK